MCLDRGETNLLEGLFINYSDPQGAGLDMYLFFLIPHIRSHESALSLRYQYTNTELALLSPPVYSAVKSSRVTYALRRMPIKHRTPPTSEMFTQAPRGWVSCSPSAIRESYES
jgi:hypothetical protein